MSVDPGCAFVPPIEYNRRDLNSFRHTENWIGCVIAGSIKVGKPGQTSGRGRVLPYKRMQLGYTDRNK